MKKVNKEKLLSSVYCKEWWIAIFSLASFLVFLQYDDLNIFSGIALVLSATQLLDIHSIRSKK